MDVNPPLLKTKALLLVPFCEGNQIAAAILDWVLTYTLLYERLKDTEAYQAYDESSDNNFCDIAAFGKLGIPVDLDGYLEASLTDLRAVIAPQLASPETLEDQAIMAALEFLRSKTLRCFKQDWGDPEERNPTFTFDAIYSPHFEAACVAWFTGQPQPAAAQPLFDRKREQQAVRKQLSRAWSIGQAATLTVDEWSETLTYFQARCAFNAEHPYKVIEHFIPIALGGGTTAFNCIPACNLCNAIKGDKHPAEITHPRLQPAIGALQNYLEERRQRWIREQEQALQ